jgi:DNA-binding Lrp family transcriptional regulator
MVNAFILLKVSRNRINEVAEELTHIPGVTETYSVAGNYDLITVIRVKSNEELAEIVTGKMLKIEGIMASETHIAFRVYSKYDLERIFAIGTE